jgi:phosphatidylserine/phosphatidylglycerophosphate/cardiolipin synthase-like enzyme
MVPLKTNNHSKYFATRAYAKELALIGANVYLYDGFIRSNKIVIDNEYILYGSFTMDREHIKHGIQNVVIIKDKKAVLEFNKLFDEDVNNSYRINNAKYMLLREKFFKNFV